MNGGGYRHEAFFYDGLEDFLDGVERFVDEGIEAGARMMAVVAEPRLGVLSERLGSRAEQIELRDMLEVGKNPARIIPAWQQFIDENDGRPMRGIGEPIFADRDPAELVECHHHEALLNAAFHPATKFNLLCPYDVAALEADTLRTACHNHPHLSGHAFDVSANDDGRPGLPDPFTGPLGDAGLICEQVVFDIEGLVALRAAVANYAKTAGFGEPAASELVLAANELATNSVRHGGGGGRLTIFDDGRVTTLEVSDAGRMADPLVGRRRPGDGQVGGRGVWIVNQLAELVQIRNTSEGCVIRARMTRE